MQETEFSFSDMLFGALRKWRKAIVFAIVGNENRYRCAAFTSLVRMIHDVDRPFVYK